MDRDFNPKKQVQRVFSSPHILADLLGRMVTLSSKNQLEYMYFLERLVGKFREVLEDQIVTLELDQKSLWAKVKKQKFGFIDGGMASISSLGSEPLAIRVGRYSVRPGLEGEEREQFSFKTQLVDELYDLTGEDAIFEEFDENQSKLRDMARICAEAGAVYQSLVDESDYDYLYIHGPLVNPVAPYADYPSFSEKLLSSIDISKEDISNLVKFSVPSGNEKHFISVYYYLLNYIFLSQTPSIGVIERNTGSKMLIFTILDKLVEENQIQKKEVKLWKEGIIQYKITDSILFACLLREGEYINPLTIDKNELHKAPEFWKSVIKEYPKPLTTYLKVSENSYPFRVEMSQSKTNAREILNITFHMARLLPQYGFPVGLDIVDKYVKVPSWMSKQVTKEQSINLLRSAINSGQTDVVDFVRLYLTGNNRDWFLRPKN